MPDEAEAWIAEVEVSGSAKRKEGVRQGNHVHSGMRDHVQTGGSGDEEVNTQGSMRWKGVRKK